ncbi:MAG TPA: DUF1565 domain-containing protein, partial [Fimbriimonas sp.]
MKSLSRLVAFGTLAAAVVPIQATTYFVSTTGSDQNFGTELFPWRTLRKGLTSLKAGDTLYVRGGLYQEILGDNTPMKIQPGQRDARIYVSASPGERPV